MINYYECCLWMRQELSKIKVMYGVIPWLDPVLLHGSKKVLYVIPAKAEIQKN
ncbi:hypothetical protein [Rickettsia endosymbiont of Orchestes rusci]|uniref:hypothetical protein n=1 Tax=Rickettsia endosymbiont of Orchestes rusci TaxID=3066250 RepID=UPI00313F35CA